MIQKTRKKLTLLCWCTSSVLFTAVLGVLIFMNYQKALESEQYFFESKISLISQEIAFTRSLQPGVFESLGENYGIYVFSETEGQWYGLERQQDKKKKALEKTAEEFLSHPENQSFSIMGTLPFDLEYSSTSLSRLGSFLGIRLELNTLGGGRNTVLALCDTSGKFFSPREAAVYALLELGGLLLLFLLCRFFVRAATQPVLAGIRQQHEFVAAASHELKSPVAVIQLNAQTMKTVDAATAGRLLDIIIGECRQLTGLIQNLMLLAAGDAGHLTAKLQELETDHFFIGLYEHYQPYCLQQGHALSLSLEETLPQSFWGDPALLKQVMGILVDNAVSYSYADTPFSLSVGRGRNHIRVSLKNSAPCLTPEQQEKLFQRFYQADASQSSPAHSGLGLSIAREILAAHGGEIYLEECREEHFLFTFRLPL